MTQDTAPREQKQLAELGSGPDNKSYRPLIFTYDEDTLRLIFKNNQPLYHDRITDQVKGLIKIRNPRLANDKQALDELYQDWLNENNAAEYGVYVYYPWSNRVVHLLPEEEFVELRTARNRHKITASEQAHLQEKCVAVIGLSVGQSVALTMALERSCGYLKLADFDELELSNLNRIKTGVHNLGLPKTIITAREIAETDPFIRFELFPEGITAENIDRFLDDEPDVDLLIEECDDLKVKIAARIAARNRGIPVLMDTSDRGMLDVERFDEEADRPLLHNLVPELDNLDVDQLPFEKRIGVLLQLVGGLSISDRLKASLLELNQSIGSWPQLSSSVGLGAGITGDIARKILLGVPVESGRYYADPEQIVKVRANPVQEFVPPKPVTPEFMAESLKAFEEMKRDQPEESVLRKAVESAALAPSSGNDQPWFFYHHQGLIGVFHNRERAYSFGDHKNFASYQSVGAAIENLLIFMRGQGYEGHIVYLPQGSVSDMMALVSFTAKEGSDIDAELVKYIPVRSTNREITPRKPVDQEILKSLNESLADFEGMEVKWITTEDDLRTQGQIIADCDKLRVFNEWGHRDFFEREMRWTPAEATNKADGIDIRGLGIDPQNMLAIQILRNYNVVSTLSAVDGGRAFDSISMDAALAASAMGLVTGPDLLIKNLLKGGQAWEKLWLAATRKGLSVHPLISPLYLFNRLHNGGEDVLSLEAREKLTTLFPRFKSLWALKNEEPLFMFRIFYTDKQPVKSMRLSIDQIYFTDGH